VGARIAAARARALVRQTLGGERAGELEAGRCGAELGKDHRVRGPPLEVARDTRDALPAAGTDVPGNDAHRRAQRDLRSDVSRRSSAAFVSVHMFFSRSPCPVSTVIARSTGPATAMQAWPAASPYRLPVGPLAPVSANPHVVPRSSRIICAFTSAYPSVLDRIPLTESSGTRSRARRATWA